jgi:hypothetical protein
MKPLTFAILLAAALPFIVLAQHEGHEPRSAGSEEGLGRAHMQTSRAGSVAKFGTRVW